MFNSGSDGKYISKADRKKAGLPILQQSTKYVGVTNGSTSSGKFVTQLPFPPLSKQATEAYTFQEFPTSLMSAGKTADDGNISIFTKDGHHMQRRPHPHWKIRRMRTLPYSIDSTMGTMATAQTNREVQEVCARSQQRDLPST